MKGEKAKERKIEENERKGEDFGSEFCTEVAEIFNANNGQDHGQFATGPTRPSSPDAYLSNGVRRSQIDQGIVQNEHAPTCLVEWQK